MIGRSVSTRIDSLCDMATGTRTQVGLTSIVASPMILRVSFTIFISSLVYPLGRKSSIWGMQLPKIGWANLDGAGGWRLPHVGLGLSFELMNALLAGPRDRLIGGDDHAAHSGGIVQWLERDHHLDRRAVGVGDDPAVLGDIVGVDLRHDQGNVGVHAEGARVVDDDRAGGCGDRAPLPRNAGRRARKHNLDTSERAGRQLVDRVTLPPGI